MARAKRTKACEFSDKERVKIYERDRYGCIFCRMGYMPTDNTFAKGTLSVMHYIPRSHGGLGVEQNGALGCQHHHEMMDNGNKGNREEMLEMFRNYLKLHYHDWDESKLIYNKWEV